MIFSIEIPDGVIIEAAAQISGAHEARLLEEEKRRVAREIFFATSAKPITEKDFENARQRGSKNGN
jgi:hypothetical protein